MGATCGQLGEDHVQDVGLATSGRTADQDVSARQCEPDRLGVLELTQRLLVKPSGCRVVAGPPWRDWGGTPRDGHPYAACRWADSHILRRGAVTWSALDVRQTSQSRVVDRSMRHRS